MDQAEIQSRLKATGDDIATAIDPDHDDAALGAQTLKISTTSAIIRLTLGKQTAIAKLFFDGASARGAFERELKALKILQKAAVPRLVYTSSEPAIIVTDEIKGTSLAELFTREHLLLRSEHIGQALGLLSNVAPHETVEGTWAEYLATYADALNADILKQQSPILKKTPIGKMALAHNDNALSNFIFGPDKHLYIVDFEDSRMKPEGWDLVTAARSVFGRFPEELSGISAAIHRGYQLSARDCMLADNFDQIISTLVLADLLQHD